MSQTLNIRALVVLFVCLVMAILVHITYSPRINTSPIGPTSVFGPPIGIPEDKAHRGDSGQETSAKVLPLCPLLWDQQRFVHWKMVPRDQTPPTLCALPKQHSNSCEWLMSPTEVNKIRSTIVGDSTINNAEFLQSRVVSASKPSVHIRTGMGEELATIIVTNISTPKEAGIQPQPAEGQCTLPHVNPLRCADDTSILFIGHSHTRFLASLHCMMLHGTHCERYDKHDNDYVLLTADDTGIQPSADVAPESTDPGRKPRPLRSLYVQSNLDATIRLPLIRASISNFTDSLKTANVATKTQKQLASALVSPSDFQDLFTHIVISKGAWEVFLYDRSPNATANEFTKSIRELRKMFPKAKIVLHMLHGYIPDPPIVAGKKSKTAKARDAWRTLCFSRQRIESVRVATLCGLERFIEEEMASISHHSESSRAPKRVPAIEIFDTISETLDPFARRYVDALGHHFTDGVLEGLVQKLLYNHICPFRSGDQQEESANELFQLRRQLSRLRAYISAGVSSVHPSSPSGLGTIGAVYGASSQSSDRETNSVTCQAVDRWTSNFQPTPNCGCLRDKHSGNGFCRSMVKHIPNRARLGGQQDSEEEA